MNLHTATEPNLDSKSLTHISPSFEMNSQVMAAFPSACWHAHCVVREVATSPEAWPTPWPHSHCAAIFIAFQCQT